MARSVSSGECPLTLPTILYLTVEHLFPLLESERDSGLLARAASALAREETPEEISPGFRLGRLTALRKPDGGVRGIVVGDITRRLVAGTVAKQVAKDSRGCHGSLPVRLVDQSRL